MITHESRSFSYVTDDNKLYEFPNQENPIVFKVTSKLGVEDFFEKDEVLSKQSYIYAMLNMYNEDFFVDSALLLIRIPSSDFESCAAYLDGAGIALLGTKSNHYLYENETLHHKLIIMSVPKTFDVDTITRSVYMEFEDDLTDSLTISEYAITSTEAFSEGLSIYYFSEND